MIKFCLHGFWMPPIKIVLEKETPWYARFPQIFSPYWLPLTLDLSTGSISYLFFIFCRRTNTMARITAKTLRTVGFTRLHSLRRIIWSFTENLRGLSWSPRFGFAEQASEFLDSKVPAVFQTLQPQDQVSCDCLRQPVYYWEVASSHESHRSLHW